MSVVPLHIPYLPSTYLASCQFRSSCQRWLLLISFLRTILLLLVKSIMFYKPFLSRVYLAQNEPLGRYKQQPLLCNNSSLSWLLLVVQNNKG